MAVTSIRLQTDLEEPLNETAAKLKRSKNWVVNEAVREYVTKCQRDEERWQATLEALDSVQAGRIVEGEAVRAWLESWGKDEELPPPQP